MEIQELEDGTIVIRKEAPAVTRKRIKIKALKDWGLKLYYGNVDKKAQYFISNKSYGAGDAYTSSNKSYVVSAIIDKELPKNTELNVNIDWEFGKLTVNLTVTENGKEYHIYSVTVEEILENIIRKRKLGAIGKAEIKFGKITSIVRKNGMCTQGIPLEAAESKFRRIFRSAKKLFKDDIESGEFIYRFCGKDSFGYEVYYIEFRISCYDLIDAEIVDRIDKILAMLK